MSANTTTVTCLECSFAGHYREWLIKRGEVTCPLCGTPESGKPEIEDDEPAIPQEELNLE
jgi:uncharacterized Zn finger protein (UPF0148 family)